MRVGVLVAVRVGVFVLGGGGGVNVGVDVLVGTTVGPVALNLARKTSPIPVVPIHPPPKLTW